MSRNCSISYGVVFKLIPLFRAEYKLVCSLKFFIIASSINILKEEYGDFKLSGRSGNLSSHVTSPSIQSVSSHFGSLIGILSSKSFPKTSGGICKSIPSSLLLVLIIPSENSNTSSIKLLSKASHQAYPK